MATQSWGQSLASFLKKDFFFAIKSFFKKSSCKIWTWVSSYLFIKLNKRRIGYYKKTFSNKYASIITALISHFILIIT